MIVANAVMLIVEGCSNQKKIMNNDAFSVFSLLLPSAYVIYRNWEILYEKNEREQQRKGSEIKIKLSYVTQKNLMAESGKDTVVRESTEKLKQFIKPKVDIRASENSLRNTLVSEDSYRESGSEN